MRDHPGMGGEKNKELEGVWLPMGSPPRGRGKDEPAAAAGKASRITPAWAGKSRCMVIVVCCSEDHPRMGGEKAAYFRAEWVPKGSPPHGRGKVVYLSVSIFSARITPAWAGKSQLKPQNQTKIEDHPRMGGEKFAAAAAVAQRQGSPPHGRGKAAVERVWKQWPGITPAWAGKSTAALVAL